MSTVIERSVGRQSQCLGRRSCGHDHRSQHGLTARSAVATVTAVVVFFLVLLPQAITAAPAKEVRRVLVFNDLGSISSPGFAAIDQAIFAGLEKSPYQIEFYNENLETTLFSDADSQHGFKEWYVHKYRDRQPDVIIGVGESSLKFMADSHETAFPNVPIIFCGSTEEMMDGLKTDSHFTGVWAVADPEKTLNAALQLRPDTKHVVIVGGVGAFDRYVEAIVKKSLHNYESKLEFTYLTDLVMPALLERLKHLPSNTIVFHTAITQDAAGAHFIDATQSVPMVASAANAPVFVVDDVDLGSGTVGGNLLSWAATGQVAASMALSVLDGEKPQDIPIVRSPNVYLFDWRALKRWGFKESDLPPGSVVLYRQPTFWQLYKGYIIAGVVLLVAQALIIIGLLWQRAHRKMGEEALASLSRRLIDAQEEERKRIAREIHDDYTQRLALLAFDLENLDEKIGDLPRGVGQGLRQIWNGIGELGADLHSLSHRLHSSTLESLGLVAGTKAFCEEFAVQQQIQVDFAHDNIPRGVPESVALCLFRIVQEGLRNVKRHSGTDRAEVRLEGSAEKLHLSIVDRGGGFDVSNRAARAGIGIHSMQERLRSLGGQLEITSRPTEGTRVDAWVPLRVVSQSAA